MVTLDSIDWSKVHEHYRKRVKVHKELLDLLNDSSASKFASRALDNEANYSAYENALKDKILGLNGKSAETGIVALANEFRKVKDGHEVIAKIEKANLKFLKVSVGSEMSCMVNPSVCWVTNTRTIWSHFAMDNNLAEANKALRLLRSNDADSKIAYKYWAAWHGEIDVSLRSLAKLGNGLARRAGIEPGDLTYLSADAIATNFYANYHST
jgi:hypothetical protein